MTIIQDIQAPVLDGRGQRSGMRVTLEWRVGTPLFPLAPEGA